MCIASLYHLVLCFACCCGTIFSIPIFLLVCLEIFLQVLNRDDRKMLVFVLAAFCWTKSLLCNVVALIGMLFILESSDIQSVFL
jgi:hypothetical protein